MGHNMALEKKDRPRGKRRPMSAKLDNKDSYEPLGELLGDRYLVVSKIGKGTFANVYCARDLTVCSSTSSSSSSGSAAGADSRVRYVAVKFQNMDATGGLGLYTREADIFSRLQGDDRVPALHSYSVVRPTISPPPFTTREALVMEMCGGEDMAALRNRTRDRFVAHGGTDGQSKVPAAVAGYLCSEMVACLQALHQRGVVHRDVKPSNFVRVSSTSTRWKVLDFGLARKWRDDGGKVSKARKDVGFRGTSDYASVWALRGQDQGPRDDLYSVLYAFINLVANSMPWSGVGRAKEHGLIALKEENSGDPARTKDKLFNWIRREVPLVDTACFTCISGLSSYLSTLQYDDMPDHGYVLGLFQPLFHASNVAEIGYTAAGFTWQHGADNFRAASKTAANTPALVHRARVVLDLLSLPPEATVTGGGAGSSTDKSPSSSSLAPISTPAPSAATPKSQLPRPLSALPVGMTVLQRGEAWTAVARDFLAVKMLRDKEVRACLVLRLVASDNFQEADPGDDDGAWTTYMRIMEAVDAFVEEYGADVSLCRIQGRCAFLSSLGIEESQLLPRLLMCRPTPRVDAGVASQSSRRMSCDAGGSSGILTPGAGALVGGFKRQRSGSQIFALTEASGASHVSLSNTSAVGAATKVSRVEVVSPVVPVIVDAHPP